MAEITYALATGALRGEIGAGVFELFVLLLLVVVVVVVVVGDDVALLIGSLMGMPFDFGAAVSSVGAMGLTDAAA